jgi:tape measure domain-containing protein
LAEVRSAHGATLAEITKQSKLEASSAIALQRQKSSAIIQIWKQQEREAARMARAQLQEQARVVRQRIAEETRAMRDIARMERERAQIMRQNSQAIERQAKAEADARIREGRRAASALASSLNQSRPATATSTGGGSSSLLAGAVGGVTALVGVSAANEIRQAALAWVDYSSKLESTRIAFTTMLGSAEAAQRHLDALQQFALKTPFQFGELIDASQRLQALGFRAEQVVPLLEDVGNAVAAAGGGSERLDRVTLALAQIQSKGRLASQEINQLAESGIPVYKMLGEQLGKSRAELVKMVESGEVSSKVFLDAFQKFSQQNFGGLMEAQSKTFTGAMSNIKDALLQTSAVAFAPLFKKLTETAQHFSIASQKSDEFKAKLKSVGDTASTAWDGAIKAIKVLSDAFRLAMAAIVQQVTTATNAFEALIHAISAATLVGIAYGKSARGDMAGAARALQDAQRELKLSVDSTTKALVAQGGVVREISNIYREAEAAAKRARDEASGVTVGGGVGSSVFDRKQGGDVGGNPFGRRSPDTFDGDIPGKTKKTPNDPGADLLRSLQIQLLGLNDATEVAKVRIRVLDEAFKNLTPELRKQIYLTAGLIDQRKEQKIADDQLADAAKELKQVIDNERESLNSFVAAQTEEINGSRTAQQEAELFILTFGNVSKGLDAATIAMIRFNAATIDARNNLSAMLKEMRENPDLVPGIGGGKGVPVLSDEDIARIAGNRATDAAGRQPDGGNRSAIDQLFEAANANLTGAKQEAALAGLSAMTEAFSGLGQAVGSVVESFVLYGSAGTSVRKVTAQILAGVAQQAAVKAIFELAEGFAALALAFFGVPNAGPSASAHFTAAAIYGGIAGVAAIAGRAVAGNAFQSTTASAGSSSGGTSRSSGRGTSTSGSSPIDRDRNRNTTIIIQGDASEAFKYKVIDYVVGDYKEQGKTRSMLGHFAGEPGSVV